MQDISRQNYSENHQAAGNATGVAGCIDRVSDPTSGQWRDESVPNKTMKREQENWMSEFRFCSKENKIVQLLKSSDYLKSQQAANEWQRIWENWYVIPLFHCDWPQLISLCITSSSIFSVPCISLSLTVSWSWFTKTVHPDDKQLLNWDFLTHDPELWLLHLSFAANCVVLSMLSV